MSSPPITNANISDLCVKHCEETAWTFTFIWNLLNSDFRFFRLPAITVAGSQPVRGRLPWQGGATIQKCPGDFYKELQGRTTVIQKCPEAADFLQGITSHQLPLLAATAEKCFMCSTGPCTQTSFHGVFSNSKTIQKDTTKHLALLIPSENMTDTMERMMISLMMQRCWKTKHVLQTKQTSNMRWGWQYCRLWSPPGCYPVLWSGLLCLLKYETAQIQGRPVVDGNGTWFTFHNRQ